MAPKKLDLSLLLVLLSSSFVPVIADTTGSGTGTDTGGGTTGTGSATGPGSTTAIFPTTSSSTSTGSSQSSPGGTGTPLPTLTVPTLPVPTLTVTQTSSSSSSTQSKSKPSPKPSPTSTSSGSGPSGTIVPTTAPTASLTTSSSSSTSTQSPTTTSSTWTSVLVVTAHATHTKTKWSTISASCGTPSPFPPALPVGCYNEGPNGRALPDFFFEDDVLMTIDKCVGLCPNYTFLGLEYGVQCWCSNSIQNGAFPVDNGQCDTVCAGNAQQICGSDDTLSLYMSPPPPPPHPANNITYSAAGCYAEPRDGSRALNKSRTAAPDMTPESCFNVCGTSGWLYAGLEYGEECWCGNRLSSAATLVDSSRCNMNCTGDATRTCGGPELLSLYNGTYKPNAVARLPAPHAPIWDRLLKGNVR